MPTIEEAIEAYADSVQQASTGDADVISIARSEDHGENWSSTIIPGSRVGDAPALAVDRHPDSRYCGNVYVAWCEAASELVFARSTSGGRTIEPATRIDAPRGNSGVQLAVGSDGTIHMLWTLTPEREPEGSETARSLFFATSHDGGLTFSDPLVVGTNIGPLGLAVAPTGRMLGAWIEAETPAERGKQPRQTIRWAHTDDGFHWSDSAALTELPADTSQGLVAAASTDDSWHVLSYDAAPSSTTVRIYSAGHDELAFRPTREIATREIGYQDIYLCGSYQLRAANDIARVADYVGLAGAGSNLAAAIVLPENDDWRSRNTPYAAVLAEGRRTG